MSGFKMDLI